MDTFNIELIGIQQEWSLDVLLNESNKLNNTIRNIDESIIQEGIGDVLKTLKDKVVKFFRWLWRKIRDFFNGIADAIGEKFGKDAPYRYDNYLNFFIKDYDGEKIVFGEFQNNICEVLTTFLGALESGIKEVESINNRIIEDIKRTKDLGGEDTVAFVDTWYKDHIEQEFMKKVIGKGYYINRDEQDDKSIITKIARAYYDPAKVKNDKDKFIFAIDPAKPNELKSQFEALDKIILASSNMSAIKKLQSTFESKIKGFENVANKLCSNSKDSKILSMYLSCTAKSSQLIMNAIKAYEFVEINLRGNVAKSFIKFEQEYKRLS